MDALVKMAVVGIAVALCAVYSESAFTARELCMMHVTYERDGRIISGYRNLRPGPEKCSCLEAREKAEAHPDSHRWVPLCMADGQWERKQNDSDGAWCVDNNGNQITEKAGGGAAASLQCD
ncbi:uncharacterized protein LOC129601564 [Paramacrobiotus metropolitanus]|uniref:uncharacterized protein LOC129601564 n=1 Tax=Paramacrobiotus metropolitanus TaxID=2943436 RepID=UPI002445A43D|nr:uncharacterized protein LOC129601564 [Paramacrobiotus metropolitanus]